MKTISKISAITLFLLSVVSTIQAKEKPATIIRQSITIDAPIAQVWQILGPGFPEAYIWAASVNHSEAKDHDSMNGSVCTQRGCNISGMGNINEKILSYSNTDYLLSYQVVNGMPSMVKYMANTWKLIDLGNGKTSLEMQMEMETGGIMGMMMNGMMRKKMTRMSAEVVEEFKYYVETGLPHPRKVESAKKFKKEKITKLKG